MHQHTSAHEPALVAALAEWSVDVPRILATDSDRGWFLMADAGPTVREWVRADGDRSRSEDMLRRFAALQQAAVPHVDHLLALGVPDRRLDRLPALYDQLLTDTDTLMVGHPDGVSRDDLTRLVSFGPTLHNLCDQAAGYKLPQTLEHDDFHSGNTGVLDGHYRFFDWGESFIAHPFYSLLIALRDAKYILEYDDASLNHLRDVYLACWADYEPLERLRDVLAITHRLAALGRALTWWQVLAQADETTRAQDGDAVPYWLLACLNDTPLD